MDSEARHPETAARFRLVDLGVDDEHLLHFGGWLTGVWTEACTRSRAARAIATTIVGPRPAGSSGAIEVAGQLVSVWSLPEPLLPPGAPALLDRDLVQTLWRAECARRRAALEAAHASCRLTRHRIDAALERLGVQVPDPGSAEARPATPATATAPPAVPVVTPPALPVLPVVTPPAPVAVARDPASEFAEFTTAVQAYQRVESLLAETERQPSADAVALADLLEGNIAVLRRRAELAGPAEVDVDAAERRVRIARIEVAMVSGGGGPDERAEIERRHHAVVETETQLAEAGRRRRAKAEARHEAAVAAERAALAGAGFDSYALFLIALTSGEPHGDERARRAAQAEFAAATGALETARRTSQLPTEQELRVAHHALRAHARGLLGREPGNDPVHELRALLVERPDHAERVRELGAALGAVGVEVAGDVVRAAQTFLASPPSIRVPQQPAWPKPAARWSVRESQSDAFPMPGARPAPEAPPATRQPIPAPPQPASQTMPDAPRMPDAQRTVRLVEAEALERQSVEQNNRLAALEAEIRELAALREVALAELAPTEFARAMETMLDAYRSGDVLAGRVPLVLDGVLDRIAADACDAAVRALARAVDVHVIVVSDDPLVMQRIRDADGAVVRWPEPRNQSQAAAQVTG